MDKAAKIEAIYRYPVKGLSAESLASTRLTLGETIAADRLYAIENGPSGFDPAAPAYLPKQRFLMLMRNERRASIERFFGEFCADELRGPPRVLHGNGHSFSDVARKVVSIINLASVAAIEDAIGAPVDPLRFRGNLYVAGWPAWHEFALLDREIGIGAAARVKTVKRIRRCAATEVDPRTAARDLPIPGTLLQRFGHGDCGVYAEVVADGEIALGDAVAEG